MTDFDELRGTSPKKLIAVSFLITLLLDFIPLPEPIAYFLPEFTLIFLVYWLLHTPQVIGIGMAFWVGLIMDVGTNSALGQHALAYIIAAFVIHQSRRQVVLFSFGSQAMAVGGVVLLSQAVLLLIGLLQNQSLSLWRLILPPLVAGLLWPLLNKLMLGIAHYRRTRI